MSISILRSLLDAIQHKFSREWLAGVLGMIPIGVIGSLMLLGLEIFIVKIPAADLLSMRILYTALKLFFADTALKMGDFAELRFIPSNSSPIRRMFVDGLAWSSFIIPLFVFSAIVFGVSVSLVAPTCLWYLTTGFFVGTPNRICMVKAREKLARRPA